MKNIIKSILTLSFGLLVAISVFAQNDEVKPEKKKAKPVRSPWAASRLIDNQTVVQPSKGSLEFIIYHRFSGMDQGISNLYGFYGASNIELTLQYGITDKLMLGFGTVKYSQMQEFYWKYKILEQTRKNEVPLSISYFGNAVIDGRDTSNFGPDYAFSSRFSYFHQIIISRKFNKKISVQTAVSYSHFNIVEEDWNNDILGIMAGARYKIHNDISALCEFHQPIALKTAVNTPTQNIALGVEFATSTHAFQIFATTSDGIVPQKNYVFNQNELNTKGLGFGFNVNVRF